MIISFISTVSEDITPKVNKLDSPVTFLTSSAEFFFKKNLNGWDKYKLNNLEDIELQRSEKNLFLINIINIKLTVFIK